jgi:hypothetical protein
VQSSTDTLKERLARYRRIKISVIGRSSGRTISIPVWFVFEGNKLYLLPVQGSDTQWYKNLLRHRDRDFGPRRGSRDPHRSRDFGNERYSPGPIVEVISKVRSGVPDPKHISTSYVERQNLTMRMQLKRLTRLTNGFSRKPEKLKAAVALHFAYYNFCRVHSNLRVTPAMEAGITDHVWEISELIFSS